MIFVDLWGASIRSAYLADFFLSKKPESLKQELDVRPPEVPTLLSKPIDVRRKMAFCKLKDALSVLKQSSKSAVVDGTKDKFDETKHYLHIEREVEEELRKIIEQAACIPGSQLILLCGNVGDGKSHLLSRLRETDPQRLSEFRIHNDATESSRWDATNIDELREVLAPHSDREVESGDSKTLVAINLGTLNNFIIAEGDNGFSRLQKYVEEMQILEVGSVADNSFDSESPYQFVSFCDYRLFDIKAEGPVSHLIEEALSRVVAEDSKNPFFAAYCEECGEAAKKCPIRCNFALLQRPKVRERFAKLLIECIVKHHQIVSVRTLYNLIYDIIIPPALDAKGADKICDSVNKMGSADLLSSSLINSPFDHPEASTVLRHLHYLDPALRRSGAIDEKVISLMVSEAPENYLSELDVPVSILEAFGATNTPTEIQVRTLVRCQYFLGQNEGCFTDQTYSDFMGLVFAWFSGDKQAVKQAYRLIGDATLAWYGAGSKGEMLVQLGNPQLDYRLSQRVDLRPIMPELSAENSERLNRFTLALPFCFALGKGTRKETLYVDYRLYEISRRVVEGYRPNNADHTSFVTFSSFVECAAENGEMTEHLQIEETATSKKFVLELDQFGEFCFEEGVR